MPVEDESQTPSTSATDGDWYNGIDDKLPAYPLGPHVNIAGFKKALAIFPGPGMRDGGDPPPESFATTLELVRTAPAYNRVSYSD